MTVHQICEVILYAIGGALVAIVIAGLVGAVGAFIDWWRR